MRRLIGMLLMALTASTLLTAGCHTTKKYYDDDDRHDNWHDRDRFDHYHDRR